MDLEQAVVRITRRRILAVIAGVFPSLLTVPRSSYGQDNSSFPEGYDAVQAAPNNHKVIFENSLVRVLEVTVPPPGTTEPMHHHRRPSFFLSWNTGGKTPHVRYHRPEGSVRDQPSVNEPVHSGNWSVKWMEPEPMHGIEAVDKLERMATEPSLLRVEIKCGF